MFVCVRKTWCAGITRSGMKVATIDDLSFLGAACDEADIVVVAKPVAMQRCYSSALLITGKTLRRSGAVEIYKKGENITVAGAVTGKHRSWTIHRFYDWKTRTYIPDK